MKNIFKSIRYRTFYFFICSNKKEYIFKILNKYLFS